MKWPNLFCCLQAQCLSQAYLQLLPILSKIPPVLPHHPNLPTGIRTPKLQELRMMINWLLAVHVHQGCNELEVWDATITAYREELLVEWCQRAQH